MKTTNKTIKGIPALVGKDPRILILGTMPGETSIYSQRYYKDKSNIFWQMIEEVLNGGCHFSNDKAREDCLFNHKISLWDVFKSCDRCGSNDSTIRNGIPNDFETFLSENPSIRVIILNGPRAAREFIKLHISIPILVAPSTSRRGYSRIGKDYVIEVWRKFLSKSICE